MLSLVSERVASVATSASRPRTMLLTALMLVGIGTIVQADPVLSPADALPAATDTSNATAATNATTNSATAAQSDLASAPPDVSKLIGQFVNWDFGAGYLRDLQKNGKDASYYLVQQNGKQMAASGSPFVNTDVVAPQTLPVPQSDKKSYQLTIQKGTAQLSGGLIEAYATSNIPLFREVATAVGKALQLKDFREFRGTLAVNSTTDFKSTVWQGGLETPALHPLQFLNAGANNGVNAMNWTFLSVLNENQDSTGNTQRNVGLFSYRSSLGRGFRPVSTDTPLTPAETNELVAKVTASAIQTSEDKCIESGVYDYGKLKTYADSIDRSSKDQALISIRFLVRNISSTKIDTKDKWESALKDYVATRYSTVHLTQSTIEAWIDSTGWYQFTGPSTNNNRFSNLMSANLRYYLTPNKGANSSWILLRYENGIERATPTVYNDYLTLSTGFAFN